MAIIGVGLIGGSLGLLARRKHLVKTVIGYGKKRGELQRAIAAGAIDRYYLSLSKAVEDADLVVLATPVGTFEKLCRSIAPYLKSGAIVTDVGSTKGAWASRMASILPQGVSFVGGHPIAGRERSGIEASTAGLFDGHYCILTPTPETPPHALKKMRLFWEVLGCTVVEMDPHEHDRIMAASSHLPHLLAYALMDTLCHLTLESDKPVRFSAGGLRDFTRVAASSPEMWRDIFLSNGENVVRMVDLYIEGLEHLKKKICANDGDGLLEILSRARLIRQKVAS